MRSYMQHHGLPDEGCQLYNATDHTKFGRHAKECPPEGSLAAPLSGCAGLLRACVLRTQPWERAAASSTGDAVCCDAEMRSAVVLVREVPQLHAAGTAASGHVLGHRAAGEALSC
jgi:hypothetical protein